MSTWSYGVSSISRPDDHFVIVEWWLPTEKTCRVEFLQQLLAEDKLFLDANDVTDPNIKEHWSEYAVKNAWPQVKDFPELIDYLPDSMEK